MNLRLDDVGAGLLVQSRTKGAPRDFDRIQAHLHVDVAEAGRRRVFEPIAFDLTMSTPSCVDKASNATRAAEAFDNQTTSDNVADPRDGAVYPRNQT